MASYYSENNSSMAYAAKHINAMSILAPISIECLLTCAILYGFISRFPTMKQYFLANYEWSDLIGTIADHEL